MKPTQQRTEEGEKMKRDIEMIKRGTVGETAARVVTALELELERAKESLYYCAAGYWAEAKPRVSRELEQALDLLGEWYPKWIDGETLLEPLQTQIRAALRDLGEGQ